MIIKEENKLWKNAPRVGTGALKDFAMSWMQIQSHLNFVLWLAISHDRNASRAYETLRKIETDPSKRTALEEQWKNRTPSMKIVAENRQFLCEIIFVRHIENYLNYVSALLFRIFQQRPETLRSQEQVRFEDVLKHDSLESLIRALALKKVESLSYSSFDELQKYFAEKFNLQLVSDKEATILNAGIEIRNISVHNRCRIDFKFLRKTSDGKPIDEKRIGEVFGIDISHLEELIPLVFTTVCRFDKIAREKFRLRASRFNLHAEWDKAKEESYKQTQMGDQERKSKAETPKEVKK